MTDQLDPELLELLVALRVDPAELTADVTVAPPKGQRTGRPRWRDRRGHWVSPGTEDAEQLPPGFAIRQPRSAPPD